MNDFNNEMLNNDQNNEESKKYNIGGIFLILIMLIIGGTIGHFIAVSVKYSDSDIIILTDLYNKI